MTKNAEIAKVVNQRIVAIKIIVPWLNSIPASFMADTATPVANGLIVEPSTPEPAPNRIVATPTNGSIPAAYIVAAINT